MQRRVTVACKFMNCGQLLILHGAVFGVNEGDGLAIMKALHDLCRSAAPPPTSSALPFPAQLYCHTVRCLLDLACTVPHA